MTEATHSCTPGPHLSQRHRVQCPQGTPFSSRDSLRRAGNYVIPDRSLRTWQYASRVSTLTRVASVRYRGPERLLTTASASLRRHTVECRCLATLGRMAKSAWRRCSRRQRKSLWGMRRCCNSQCSVPRTACERHYLVGTITDIEIGLWMVFGTAADTSAHSWAGRSFDHPHVTHPCRIKTWPI